MAKMVSVTRLQQTEITVSPRLDLDRLMFKSQYFDSKYIENGERYDVELNNSHLGQCRWASIAAMNLTLNDLEGLRGQWLTAAWTCCLNSLALLLVCRYICSFSRSVS